MYNSARSERFFILEQNKRTALTSHLLVILTPMGFGLTPLLGDCRGFMPPQLKTKPTYLLHFVHVVIERSQ